MNICASVGEPTPIPERPTLHSILSPYNDGSWSLASPSTIPYRIVRTDRPGSVLVTIPGTRDASPTEPRAESTPVADPVAAFRAFCSGNTAPRAEGGDFKNFHRLLCERFGYTHDERDWQRDQLSLIEHIAAMIPTPPRDRCEVCGGTPKEVSDARGIKTGWTCPACTKETPCDSGSGSSVASSATSSPQKPASQSPVVDANTSNPNGSASNRATVTGEGPYRVAYERANRMFYVVKPDGERTCFGKRSIAQHAANLANHAHHTTLAVREAEVVRLRKALEPFAKFAGSKFAGTVWEDRPSSPVLFHSFTGSSVTANDFYAARDALKGAAR
jgi:hypothetical protein